MVTPRDSKLEPHTVPRENTTTTMIINNYWTRLSKISWLVSDGQINYLPKTEAEANNRSARHWQITIYFDNRVQSDCFIIRSPGLFFNEYLREAKQSSINFFHARAIARRRKAWFRLRMTRVLFAAKHSWTTLRMSRPLFVGSYLQVTWWTFGQWKEEKICIGW